MGKTEIEWTDHSENPIRARLKSTGAVGHYCEKVNTGCKNCYASNLQKRFQMPSFGAGQNADDVENFLCERTLERIRKRKKPTKFFLGDMTDLFGHWVKREWIHEILNTIDDCPQHTFQILTKRPENILEYWPIQATGRSESIFPGAKGELGKRIPTYGRLKRDNVWLGTSVATQETAEQAIPDLLKCRGLARHLFLSCEPLVGPVDLSKWFVEYELETCQSCGEHCEGYKTFSGKSSCCHADTDTQGSASESEIDWVIIGGESGQKARPCEIEWIESVVSQCRDAGVDCFVKQLGSNPVYFDDGGMAGKETIAPYQVSHGKGGDMSEWPSDLRVREMPE